MSSADGVDSSRAGQRPPPQAASLWQESSISYRKNSADPGDLCQKKKKNAEIILRDLLGLPSVVEAFDAFS